MESELSVETATIILGNKVSLHLKSLFGSQNEIMNISPSVMYRGYCRFQ